MDLEILGATTINRKTLVNGLKQLKYFRTGTPTLPILDHLSLRTSDGSLIIKRIDSGMEGSISVKIQPYGISGEIDICVKETNLAQLINSVKSDGVEIKAGTYLEELETSEYDDNGNHVGYKTIVKQHTGVQIIGGNNTFKCKALPGEEFPKWRDDDDAEEQETLWSGFVNWGEFVNEMKFVIRASSCDMPKNYTYGVLFLPNGNNNLNIVGTDGRRLHSTKLGEVRGDDKTPALLPSKLIKSFMRAGFDKSESITFTLKENMMTWWIGDYSGSFVLLDTPYPDYEKVIPEECGASFTFEPKEAIQVLEPLVIIAKQDDGRDMVVVRANSKIRFSAKAESMGEGDGEMNCVRIGGEHEMVTALNIFSLLDALRSAVEIDANLIMTQEGSLEPVRFDYPETERISVIMPVRLPE